MRAPDPAVLLLDHPAIPLPEWCRAARGPAGIVDPARLSLRDRQRLAAQLTAVAALLSEHDLWPGASAVRRAMVWRGSRGLRVELGGWPRSLTGLSRRLGGGQQAAERLRDRFLAEVGARFSLELPPVAGEGYFLEPALRRLLKALGPDVDTMTGRALWALRWPLPPTPGTGEVGFWATPTATVGARLGAALWASHRRCGGTAWLRRIGGDDATAPLPPLGGAGLAVLVGELNDEELAGLARWAEGPGRAGVAIGRFPAGWSPSAVPLDPVRLDRHLAVVGAGLEQCRELVERRRGHFHPLSRRDRVALTRAVVRLVGGRSRDGGAAPEDPLVGWLRLLPEGLPEGFVRLHVGIPEAVLEHRAESLGVVRRGGRWRLPDPAPLRPDGRHRQVAPLFAPEDPRRWRHLALAGEEPGELVRWCRGRLAELAPEPVHRLLEVVERGALGSEVEGALASACLLRCDLAGARRALAAMPAPAAEPWRRWSDVVDRVPGRGGLLDRQGETMAPLAAAVVALDGLRLGGEGDLARRALARLASSGGGTVRRWLDLELAAFEAPARLADRGWRRAVAGGHPWLWRRLVWLRALQLAEARPRAARRLLSRLADAELTPGERGLLELDRGFAELGLGRTEAADVHGLRALHLLEAAGFEGRTRSVRFNLAVTDLDRLRVTAAAARLGALDADDPFVLAEWARWQLAVGDEPAFDAALTRLAVAVEVAGGDRLAEAHSLLAGVRSLLDGRLDRADELLKAGGEEGEPWLGLCAALSGRPPAPAVGADGWGVGVAAGWVAGGGPPPDIQAMVGRDLRAAFALALLARLGRVAGELDAATREAAAGALGAAGLTGWARWLRQLDGARELPADVLSRLLEEEDPAALDEDELGRLLQWLGVGGIEVRRRGSDTPLWRVGVGEPGPASRIAGLDVASVGGEPAAAAWRLFTAVVGTLLGRRTLPAVARPADTLGLVGASSSLEELRAELRRLAPTRVSVLLTGETGTGKELAARALHRLSGRGGAFVPVNMAAIPEGLLEAELFGAVRGAFTGAERGRRGLAVAADGGTLFLDEIGDLPLPLQVKLLRFLESGEVRAVGSDTTARVEVRIVAATHRDLAARVAAGTFRQDLYFRLAQATVRLAPLRERRGDIPLLRAAFEEQAMVRDGLRPCRWSRAAEQALERHDWPGNVRELRHAIEVAMVRADGGTVAPDQLPIRPADGPEPARRWDEALAEFKRDLLAAALRRNGGNRSATARELGLSRQALLYHLRTLGVS